MSADPKYNQSPWWFTRKVTVQVAYQAKPQTSSRITMVELNVVGCKLQWKDTSKRGADGHKVILYMSNDASGPSFVMDPLNYDLTKHKAFPIEKDAEHTQANWQKWIRKSCAR